MAALPTLCICHGSTSALHPIAHRQGEKAQNLHGGEEPGTQVPPSSQPPGIKQWELPSVPLLIGGAAALPYVAFICSQNTKIP